MFFHVNFGSGCSYDSTLSVSGNGSFFFDSFLGYLYVTDQGASSNSIFKIYDMSNPNGPVLRSTTSLPNGSGAVHPKGFVLSGYGLVCLIPYRVSKKVAIWDVNDPTTPSLLGSVDVDFKPNSVAALGTYACVGYNENFLQTKSASLIDISDPTSPTITADWSASKLVERVRASDSYFFLAGEDNSGGANRLTIRHPTTFASVGTVSGGSSFAGTGAGQLALNAAYTYAFTAHSGGDGLQSWDISNPASPSYVSNCAVSFDSGACIAIKNDTNRAYYGRGGGGGGGGPVEIIDISDPSSMSITGTISTSSETVTDICIIDDGCAGLAWAQGTGAAIHLVGTPPLS